MTSKKMHTDEYLRASWEAFKTLTYEEQRSSIAEKEAELNRKMEHMDFYIKQFGIEKYLQYKIEDYKEILETLLNPSEDQQWKYTPAYFDSMIKTVQERIESFEAILLDYKKTTEAGIKPKAEKKAKEAVALEVIKNDEPNEWYDGYVRHGASKESRDISHLITADPHKELEDAYGRKYGLFLSDDERMTLIISDLELSRSDTAVKLFWYVHQLYAACGRKTLKMHFKVGDFAKARGIARNVAREQLIRDTAILLNASIRYHEKDEANKLVAGGGVNLFTLTDVNKQGEVKIHFSPDYAESLTALVYMPEDALRCNSKAFKYTYRMCWELSAHINMNWDKSNNGIIGVKTLLKACDFAKYDPKSRQFSKRILTPFKQNMNAIKGLVPGFQWGFKVHGCKEWVPEDYAEFLESLVWFKWPDHPTYQKAKAKELPIGKEAAAIKAQKKKEAVNKALNKEAGKNAVKKKAQK